MKIMLLYHFTCRLWLPDIMRQGLDRGELPVDLHKFKPADVQAVNLTSNPDPISNFRVWGQGCGMDKTRIRISVEWPETELVTFRQVREKCQTPEKWLKQLAPYEERRKWFYVFGVVPSTAFAAVAIREGTICRDLLSHELSQLIESIDKERERALVISKILSGRLAGIDSAKLNPGVMSSWLVDEKEAIEEFRL